MNHTGIGWDEALVMLQSSSNSSTSSERPDTTKTPDPSAPAKVVLVRNPQVNPLPNEKPQPAPRYTLWEKAQRIFGIETRREKRRRIIKEIEEKGLRGMYANIPNMGEDVGIVYRSPANRGSHPNSAQSNEPSSYSKRSETIHKYFRLALKQSPSSCDHLKGFRRKADSVKDFNVYLHTFPNGVNRIRCNKCGFCWFPDDTVENITRDGKILPNSTKLGFREALLMVNCSSNDSSSSEITKSFWKNIRVSLRGSKRILEDDADLKSFLQPEKVVDKNSDMC